MRGDAERKQQKAIQEVQKKFSVPPQLPSAVHSCESARKNWQRRRRRRRSNWGRHLVGPLFLRDEFQPSKAWALACSGTHNKICTKQSKHVKTHFRHVPALFLGTSQEQERARAERAAAATRAAAASSSSRKRPSSAEESAAKRRLRVVSTYGLPARVRCLDLKTEQVDTI